MDHGAAHHNMALMDLQGMGRSVNETSALDNYRKAADLGETSALAGMAYMYMQNKVKVDRKEGAEDRFGPSEPGSR